MGSSAWYHVLVVGSELPGLVYAALCAREGYRVAVVGQGGRPNLYRREGRALLRHPELVYGLGSSPTATRVFTDLSMMREMQMRPGRVEPPLQVAGPDLRLELLSQAERWEREMTRELGADAVALMAFESWADHTSKVLDRALGPGALYPPRGLRAAARYRAMAQGLDALEGDSDPAPLLPPRAAWVVRAPLMHASGLHASPAAAARLWTQLKGGLVRLPDGLDGLARLFLERLREQYGEWRTEDRVTEILLKGSKAVHARLDRGEMLGCDLLVANLDPHALLPLLPRDRRLGRLGGVDGPWGWRCTYNLVVDPRVFPQAMSPELVWVANPQAPLHGANNLWISRPGRGPHSDRDGRPGPGTMTISALVPRTGGEHGGVPGVAALEALGAAIERALVPLCPWVDRFVLQRDMPALRDDPASGRRIVDAAELTPLYDRSIPGTLGLGAFPQDTGHARMLLAGGAPFAGLGFEGAFCSALQLLERTRRIIKLRARMP